MAKDKLTEYSATNASNDVIGDISVAEGMLPSAVNNALREQMTHLKNFSDGTDGINVLSLADDDASASIKIQAPSAVTTTTTLTLPDGDGDAGAMLQTNGSGQLAWSTAYRNRNLIINGAMQVAQRGTSSTGFVGASSYLTVDRFKLENGSSGTFTVTQATDAPTGFANSLKFDCTTADSSPDYFLIVHRMEGQNLQHLQKGTSSAKKTTLSFHVKSSKTGTYQVNLRDVDNSRLIGATYAISSANTWEKKIVTFDGDTSGVLGNDTGNSLSLEWWIASGSTYNSGAVPTAWEAIANGDRAAGLNVAIGASTDDEFLITGVQLEVGEQATPFEHRSYAEELAACQRYFETIRFIASTVYPAVTNQFGSGGQIVQAYKVTKRTTPTVSIDDTSWYKYNVYNGSNGAVTISAYAANEDYGGVSHGNLGASSVHWFYGNSGTTTHSADAEL